VNVRKAKRLKEQKEDERAKKSTPETGMLFVLSCDMIFSWRTIGF
jgi:hypothetical protein